MRLPYRPIPVLVRSYVHILTPPKRTCARAGESVVSRLPIKRLKRTTRIRGRAGSPLTKDASQSYPAKLGGSGEESYRKGITQETQAVWHRSE
jgi:hypothetical protein